DLVHHCRVVGRRPHVLTNALDEVGAPGATGVHRPFGVGPDDLDPATIAIGGDLAQVPTSAGDRAAGADARDEVRDLAAGVSPDLGTGRQVVALGVLGVGVLVGLPATLDLLGQPVAHRVVRVGVLRRQRCRGHHDLGAVGLQDVALVLADLVGADEHALVSAALGDQGQPDPGVARGGFHDGAARLELTAGLGGIDHPNGDAVLDRATGVDVLHLGQNGAGNP